jgi:hypothetical protein
MFNVQLELPPITRYYNYTLSIKNIAAAIGLSHTEIEALN